MPSLEQLLERYRRGPTGVRFDELKTFLIRNGFDCRQPRGGGSHYVFSHPLVPGVHLTIPRPHGSRVKPFYVSRAVELVDQLRE